MLRKTFLIGSNDVAFTKFSLSLQETITLPPQTLSERILVKFSLFGKALNRVFFGGEKESLVSTFAHAIFGTGGSGGS
jgi:hypothetical protein